MMLLEPLGYGYVTSFLVCFVMPNMIVGMNLAAFRVAQALISRGYCGAELTESMVES